MSAETRSPWLLTAWAAGLVSLGGICLAGAWPGWVPVVVLLAACVLPMLVLRAVVALGISRWAATSVLGLLLVLTAYLMAADSDTSLGGTITDAVPLLLTSPQPYAVRADLLAAPVLLAGLVSLFAGLRVESRHRVGPLAGGGVLYVAGMLLTTGDGDPWGLLAVLLVVLAVLGWVLLDDHPEPSRRRLVVATPALVVLVGALASVALVPAAQPFDPRTLVDPPLTVVETASPLPQLGAWASDPDAELLRVTGDAVPLRLVTLDRYDGAQWRAATRFAPLGSTATPPLTGERRRTSTVSVSFAELGGHWLPTPGDPVEVTDPEAVVDTATGTLYAPATDPSTSYRVTGSVDHPDPDRLVGATVPTSGRALAYVRQPDLPRSLAQYAAAVVPNAPPYEQALAIEAAVREGRRLSPRAISGSAFWRIEKFLLGKGPGAQVGTTEQFATAFAIIARQAGLPTRVVVGFRPGSRQPDGTRVVHGRDALAWPEVYFEDLGWVPFSPTPNDDTFTQGRPQLADTPVADPEPEETTAPRDGGGADRDAPAEAEATAPAPAPGGPSWLLAAVVAGLVAGPLTALALARAVRSHRHRRRGAAGAWAEVYDALVLAGSPPPRWEPAPDVAERADRRFGTDAALVAARAEQAAFGPGGPGGTTAVLAAPVAEVRAVRRAARASVPWWRRWWWAFDPRVLGRRGHR